MQSKTNQVLEQVVNELTTATQNFPKFHSAHEGFAILKEEVDELWECVRLKQTAALRTQYMRKEAIQVAAMALRFIIESCDE